MSQPAPTGRREHRDGKEFLVHSAVLFPTGFATNLGASKKLAASGSLEDARDQFKILSRKAVHLAEGRSGYHRFVCPHVPEEDGKWVQKIATASNPYE